MGITVTPAEDQDMVRLFTITSLAFKDNEPFWDAMYPNHSTEQGRRTGGARFLQAKNSDPNTTFVKAVNDSTGEIAGFAKWNVFKDFVPKAGKAEGDYWANDEEKQYCQHLMTVFIEDRTSFVQSKNGNAVNLDILVIDPKFQRMGIGGKLVAWGTDRADELGFDACVVSSVFGKGLYEKNGFVFQKDVTMRLPEQWEERPKSRYAWLVRPKKV